MINALGIPIPNALLSSPDGEELQVRLEVSQPGRGRKIGNAAMVALAQQVAMMSDDKYEVVLSNGSSLKGGDLTLSEKVTLQVPVLGGQIDQRAIFQKIDTYLDGLISDNTV